MPVAVLGTGLSISGTVTTALPGLTEQEKNICGHLAAAWNGFLELNYKFQDDVDEFRQAIHAAQQLVGQRVARRVNPELWAQPPYTLTPTY